VILFSRQPAEYDGKFHNLFSVASPQQTSAKSRVIVEHSGENSGVGVWSCSKDRGSKCGHIAAARHHLQKLLHVDPSASDHGVHDSPDVQATGVFYNASFHFLLLILFRTTCSECDNSWRTCGVVYAGPTSALGLPPE
jgi:hypothetical protein